MCKQRLEGEGVREREREKEQRRGREGEKERERGTQPNINFIKIGLSFCLFFKRHKKDPK